MELGLKNKKALILGSSKGLGLGIAKNLILEGAHVGIVGRSIGSLKALSLELGGETQARIVPFQVDFTKPDASRNLFQQFMQQFDGIDILVNNTGGPPATLALETSMEQWQDYFASMVLRLIELTQLFLPIMQSQRWGRVLTIGSSGVIQPIPGLAISNVLRTTLLSWSKTLATEVAPYGITVNMILPGKIFTERLQTLNKIFAEKNHQSTQEFSEQVLKTIPMQRFGSVQEFADIATFYLSECASYTTGNCIRVDGGYTSTLL